MKAPEPQEMTISDILENLIQGKMIIALSIVLGGAVAALFIALFPTYSSEAQMLPPSSAVVDPLNVVGFEVPLVAEIDGRSIPLLPKAGFPVFTSADVFARFLTRVQSRALHRRVLVEQGLVPALAEEVTPENRAAADRAFRRWESGFSIYRDWSDADKPGIVRVAFSNKEPEVLAALVNGIVQRAGDEVLQELRTVVEVRIANRRRQIATKTDAMRQQYSQERLDRIVQLVEKQAIDVGRIETSISVRQQSFEARRLDGVVQLKEAIAIAEAAGIEAPLSAALASLGGFNLDLSLEASAYGSSGYKRQGGESEFAPLALYGSKMLKAELKQLEDRESADPFIGGLRALQEELQWRKNDAELEVLRARTDEDPFISGLRRLQTQDAALAALILPTEGVAAMELDQLAWPPLEQIRGWGYVVPGMFGGALVGLALALLRAALRRGSAAKAS